MSKQDLKTAAKKLFDVHPNIEKLYLTSDGQGFTKEHHADDHSKKLVDKEVQPFTRASVLEKNDTSEDGETIKAVGEREALVAKYELLFGEKPAHNIGVTKLKNRIAEKEAEVKNAPVATDVLDTAAKVETNETADAEKASAEDKKEQTTASEADGPDQSKQ